MQMIYNSPNYCVLEFPAQLEHCAMRAGGYEIVNKNTQRELFMGGLMAENFRVSIQRYMEQPPSLDEVDEFLGQFGTLMNYPVILH